MNTYNVLPGGANLDTQRAEYLQTVHPSTGILDADIIASPMLSRRHRITRAATRAVGVIGLTSAALGVTDAYNGATHDIPKAKEAVVQEVEAIDMRDTDTAITTGLFTEQGAAKMQATGQDVQYAVNKHSDELQDAFNKTSNGAVQGVLGSGMLLASMGAGSVLKRRAKKQQGAPIELKDNGTIDQQIFPDALYNDRLTLRHISKNGPKDTSQVLELQPSKRYRNKQDQIEFKAFGGAAAVLTGLFIAASPATGVAAETIDNGVTALRETAPVASASDFIAQKATEAAKPKLSAEIKSTTRTIIVDKLPKTEQLAHKMPLMAAVKEKIATETAAQVLDVKPQKNPGANESHALGDLYTNTLSIENPVYGLTGVLGLGGLVISRTIRRKSHLRSDAHTKVLVSRDFLQANINPTPK